MYEVFSFLLGAFSVKSDNRNARIANLDGCHLETIRDNEHCDSKVGLKSTADSVFCFPYLSIMFRSGSRPKNAIFSNMVACRKFNMSCTIL
jgi:hypothetical protein